MFLYRLPKTAEKDPEEYKKKVETVNRALQELADRGWAQVEQGDDYAIVTPTQEGAAMVFAILRTDLLIEFDLTLATGPNDFLNSVLSATERWLTTVWWVRYAT